LRTNTKTNGRKTSRQECYVLTTLLKAPSQPYGPSYTCIQGGPYPTVDPDLTTCSNLDPNPLSCPSYCSMKLKTVASLSATTVNGTHRPEHKVGKRMVEAGLAFSAPTQLKAAVSKLCCVRRRNPGNPKLINNPTPKPFLSRKPSLFPLSQVRSQYFSVQRICRTASKLQSFANKAK
jgi:hypothetical protein